MHATLWKFQDNNFYCQHTGTLCSSFLSIHVHESCKLAHHTDDLQWRWMNSTGNGVSKLADYTQSIIHEFARKELYWPNSTQKSSLWTADCGRFSVLCKMYNQLYILQLFALFTYRLFFVAFVDDLLVGSFPVTVKLVCLRHVGVHILLVKYYFFIWTPCWANIVSRQVIINYVLLKTRASCYWCKPSL